MTMRHFSRFRFCAMVACSIGLFGALDANAQGTPAGYDAMCNANGYVLAPGPSAQLQSASGKTLRSKLYLGISCDAYSENLGEGAWCWTNAGVLTEFDGETFPLTHYELPSCSQHSDSSPCGCWDAPLPSFP
jgi:hypothetical protein